MLKALLFAILAVAQVLAKSDKVEFGQCTKDRAKMSDIKAKMTQLGSTLTEAAENSVQDLTRMFQSGSLDDRVFTKMCSVAPDVISDIGELSEVIASCYDPAHQTQVDELMEFEEGIVKDTINFVCDDDGAKIIKFLEEDGINCLKSKEDDIEACFNLDLDTVEIQQDAADDVHKCVMNALDACSSSTPAEIFDAWYKKIRHNIPETTSGSESDNNDDGASDGKKKKKKNKRKGKNSSSSVSSTSINLLPIIYLVVAYFN